jgi:tRNA(fMet)-specific endonuclease VapC
VRQSTLYNRLELMYQLSSANPTPMISVVSEGEIRALAKELKWGLNRLSLMEDLPDYLLIVPIPFANVVPQYANIAEFSRRSGRSMGKNDLWIAATAMELGATLLTTDKDFDHLTPDWIDSIWIAP